MCSLCTVRKNIYRKTLKYFVMLVQQHGAGMWRLQNRLRYVAFEMGARLFNRSAPRLCRLFKLSCVTCKQLCYERLDEPEVSRAQTSTTH